MWFELKRHPNSSQRIMINLSWVRTIMLLDYKDDDNCYKIIIPTSYFSDEAEREVEVDYEEAYESLEEAEKRYEFFKKILINRTEKRYEQLDKQHEISMKDDLLIKDVLDKRSAELRSFYEENKKFIENMQERINSLEEALNGKQKNGQ